MVLQKAAWSNAAPLQKRLPLTRVGRDGMFLGTLLLHKFNEPEEYR